MTRGMLWSRSIHRVVHLLFAVFLGIYIYSPLSNVGAAELFIQAVVFPGLALSGVLLWKASRLRGWHRARKVKGKH